MIKHIDLSHGFSNTIGYIQLIEWVHVDYDQPQKSGHYIVADGNGHTRQVNFALNDFQDVIFRKPYSIINNTKVYWHSSGIELSASELLSIVDYGNVWYYTSIEEDIEGCPDTFLISILDTSDFEFWIDANDIFHGPTEIDLKRSPCHVTKDPMRNFKHNNENVIRYITTVNPNKTNDKE